MSERACRIRLIRQFVDPLTPEDIPEGLRDILVIPDGKNFVDVEVSTEVAQAIRDLADNRFWTLDERTQGTEIRAAHATRTLVEATLRRGAG